MKKLLLAAVALLFTVGASAQDFKLNVGPKVSPVSEKTIPFKPLRSTGVTKSNVKAVQRAATPEGEQREYLVNCAENVSMVTKETNLVYQKTYEMTFVFADDGKTVYFSNPLYAPYLSEPIWIEGELSGNTLTVQPNQPMGTLGQYDCYLGSADPATGRFNVTTPIVFDYNPDLGTFISEDGVLALMAFQNGSMLGALTYEVEFTMMPMDSEVLDGAVTRKYTANVTNENGQAPIESTVEDVFSPVLGLHFIKGLMPTYSDGWMMAGAVSEGSDDIAVLGGQIVSDDVLTYFGQSQATTMPDFNNTYSIFTYNADGSYTQTTGDLLFDYFYGTDGKNEDYYSSVIYSDITLGAPTQSGISSVETDKGEPVATEYYDLSGRRVDAAAKGVTIRVDKYADGTSKAVKAIK